MVRDVGNGAGGQFISMSGPDGSKIGTDFSVIVALAANSVTGKCGLTFPQDSVFGSIMRFCVEACGAQSRLIMRCTLTRVQCLSALVRLVLGT